jgi:GPH family glycoside/pentoside/hexuronide:cation symporter
VLAWLMLVLTYAAYSALSVAHQSWGAMLGGDEAQRSRVVAWREGLGLVGVLLASCCPGLGLPATVAVFARCWWGWLAWSPRRAPSARADRKVAATRHLWLPFTRPAFRRLLACLLNGIASAVPATLVLFFVQDRLQAPRSGGAAFLGSYFLCAALSIPLWLRLVARLGLARSWLAGMLLAVPFVWATQLGAGDVLAFLVVCALSGVALGTDLALPGACWPA